MKNRNMRRFAVITASVLFMNMHLPVYAMDTAMEITETQIMIDRSVPNYISTKDLLDYVQEIGKQYEIDPYLLFALVERESTKDINAENGSCKGLCQISEKWHSDRMEKLGIDDIWDPYNNITLAADFLKDLEDINPDPYYMLMRYNMETKTANAYYEQGKITNYAKDIVSRSIELREEYEE